MQSRGGERPWDGTRPKPGALLLPCVSKQSATTARMPSLGHSLNSLRSSALLGLRNGASLRKTRFRRAVQQDRPQRRLCDLSLRLVLGCHFGMVERS